MKCGSHKPHLKKILQQLRRAPRHRTWLFFPLATHSLFLSCGAGQSIWRKEREVWCVKHVPRNDAGLWPEALPSRIYQVWKKRKEKAHFFLIGTSRKHCNTELDLQSTLLTTCSCVYYYIGKCTTALEMLQYAHTEMQFYLWINKMSVLVLCYSTVNWC